MKQGQSVPDDRFFDYNTGYTILERLVEALDGREFPTYVGKEILDPIGMERSVLAPDNFDDLVEHAVSTAYVGFLEDAGIGIAIACNDSP